VRANGDRTRPGDDRALPADRQLVVLDVEAQVIELTVAGDDGHLD
jgi:hypothetical protein